MVVTCILLGQVGESTGKGYRSGKIVLVLFTIWFFGNFVLMTNLYQGSMYSSLAVLKPKTPPSGVYDLVNWDIPLVSLDMVYDYKSGSTKTILVDYIIPALMSSGGKDSELSKFLSKLKANFVYAKTKTEQSTGKALNLRKLTE